MFGLLGGAALRRFARVVATAAVAFVVLATANGVASAETRTLKIYHVHLREKSEIVYKRNGRFLPDGLKKLNWAMRDWRESKPTNMDPALFDLMWEAYRQSGSRDYISVIGGYRSPGTNRKLRSRSSGVADKSLHMQGKAVDFFIPDVPLRRIRDIGLKMQVGGVGYYPRSGSPFVHFDTGKGRHWPRLSRKELVSVFPNGNTIHVPSDGKPLPGYETALASYNKRRSSESIQIANATERRSGGGRSLLAAIFGGGAEEAEDEAEAQTAPTPAARTPQRRAPEPQVQVAAAEPERRTRAPQPPVQVAAAEPTRRPAPPAALPTGVPMPERGEFDTTSRTPTPPAAIPAREPETATETAPRDVEVAALELARVPMPTAAPGRIAAATAVAQAPTAAPPAEPVASSLVAALEEAAPSPAAAAQLAYAVPMPSRRPPFEAVLSGVAAQVAAATPTPAAAPAAQLPDPVIASVMPATAPRAEALVADVAEAAPSEASVAMASLADAMRDSAPTSELTPFEEEFTVASLGVQPAPQSSSGGLSGKSGRVLTRNLQPAAPAEAATSVASAGETPSVASAGEIASRIEVANSVTSPDERLGNERGPRANTQMLSVDVPVSGVASAFAPRSSVGASDRFIGSAGQFGLVRDAN